MKKLYKLTAAQLDYCSITNILPKKTRDMFFITTSFTVKENPDIEALEKSFNRLLDVNDSLRTRFTHTIKGRRQYIEDYIYEKLPIIELETKEKLLEAIEKNKKFKSIYNEPLYKAIIFKYENKATLLMVFYHTIFDGYSIGLAMKQIRQNYEAYINGETPKNEAYYSIENYYKDYENYRHSERFKNDCKYWKHAINDRKDFKVLTPWLKVTKLNNRKLTINGNDYIKSINVCNSLGITIPFLISSIAAITLSKKTNIIDFNFSNMSHGRTKYVQKQAIGCYATLFHNFYHINNSDDVSCFLKTSYIDYLESMKHMNISPLRILFYSLKKELQIFRFNLFGIVFSSLNIGQNEKNSKYDYEFIPHQYQPNQFYCSITDDNKNEIELILLYQSKLLPEEEIDEILNNYQRIFKQVINNVDLKIKDICYLKN